MHNKLKAKKIKLNNGLNRFFDEFLERNKLIFAKLKDTVNIKENTLIDKLQNMKRKISLFYNEQDLINDSSTFNGKLKKLDINLRKDKKQ